METAFVSTTLSNLRIRQSTQSLQMELSQLQVELASGKKFDAGLELGTLSSVLVSSNRRVETIEQVITGNGFLQNRMQLMQDGLSTMVQLAQDLTGQLLAESSASLDRSIIEETARSSAGQFISVANTTLRGEFIFSGINTDVEALADYADDPASAARVAVQTAFLAEFGFAVSDPAAATIDPTAMRTFLEGTYDALFDDTPWQNNWSGSSQRGMRFKYTLSETVDLPATAQAEGFRQVATATAIILELSGSDVNDTTFDTVMQFGVERLAQATAEFGKTQSALGIVEERVSNASERLDYSGNILRQTVSELEEVDDFETATRIYELLTKIEASYSLTVRLQALSIMNYV